MHFHAISAIMSSHEDIGPHQVLAPKDNSGLCLCVLCRQRESSCRALESRTEMQRNCQRTFLYWSPWGIQDVQYWSRAPVVAGLFLFPCIQACDGHLKIVYDRGVHSIYALMPYCVGLYFACLMSSLPMKGTICSSMHRCSSPKYHGTYFWKELKSDVPFHRQSLSSWLVLIGSICEVSHYGSGTFPHLFSARTWK